MQPDRFYALRRGRLHAADPPIFRKRPIEAGGSGDARAEAAVWDRNLSRD